MKTLITVMLLSLIIVPIFSMAESITYKDPFDFCKALRNVDGTGTDGFMDDKRYVGPEAPSAILKAFEPNSGPIVWRCMDGNVYGCILGASGRGCMKWWNVALKPTPTVKRFCANHPNSWVANAENDTPWSWVCRGTTAVIDTSVKKPSLDKRGYYVDAWKKIVHVDTENSNPNLDSDKSLSIGVLKNSVIDDCSCSFHRASPNKNTDADQYIFVVGYSGQARININGRDIELRENGRKKDESGRCARNSCTYSGSGITATARYRQTSKCPPEPTECEVNDYDVTITVEKGGHRQILRGKGQCGC